MTNRGETEDKRLKKNRKNKGKSKQQAKRSVHKATDPYSCLMSPWSIWIRPPTLPVKPSVTVLLWTSELKGHTKERRVGASNIAKLQSSEIAVAPSQPRKGRRSSPVSWWWAARSAPFQVRKPRSARLQRPRRCVEEEPRRATSRLDRGVWGRPLGHPSTSQHGTRGGVTKGCARASSRSMSLGVRRDVVLGREIQVTRLSMCLPSLRRVHPKKPQGAAVAASVGIGWQCRGKFVFGGFRVRRGSEWEVPSDLGSVWQGEGRE